MRTLRFFIRSLIILAIFASLAAAYYYLGMWTVLSTITADLVHHRPVVFDLSLTAWERLAIAIAATMLAAMIVLLCRVGHVLEHHSKPRPRVDLIPKHANRYHPHGRTTGSTPVIKPDEMVAQQA